MARKSPRGRIWLRPTPESAMAAVWTYLALTPQPLDQHAQQLRQRQRRRAAAAARIFAADARDVPAEPFRQGRARGCALLDRRQAFDSERGREPIIGADQREPFAPDNLGRGDAMGAPFVVRDDEAAMGQSGRGPGDALVIAVGELADDRGQLL